MEVDSVEVEDMGVVDMDVEEVVQDMKEEEEVVVVVREENLTAKASRQLLISRTQHLI